MEVAMTGLAGAGGPLAALGGMGSMVAGILQGVATATAAAARIEQGRIAAETSMEAALHTDLEAGQSRVQSAQRQAMMRRELLSVLGENDVAFAAAGVEVGSGIARQNRLRAERRAMSEQTIEEQQEAFRGAMFRARASAHRRRAQDQWGAGLMEAAGMGLNFGIDLLRRG